MNKPELFNESNQSTYCPEDDKLRLYVGRVPRDEYLALRDEGWTSTPKQSCDFVAVWTPQRAQTAESYAGIIEDEDQTPEERAADRAERFGGYLDKRLDEATGHADKYDAGPQVHGFQNYAKAVRAADRHDRIGTRATDAWSKAEYWQRRTAGVIAHALYKSTPSVRMGRIKELELAIARHEKHERDDAWTTHFRLRLAYENQMLEAVGGRAATVEMEAGGWLGKHQIYKVTRSPVTKLVVSVELKYMSDSNQYGRPWSDGKGPRLVNMLYNIERLPAGAYTPPTEEERAAFKATTDATKKAKAAVAKEKAKAGENCPLINPTDADAQKLQDLWNAKALECGWYKRNGGKPSEVLRLTQSQYSANSGGSYSRANTITVCEHGTKHETRAGDKLTRCDVFKVRAASNGYSADRVIIITDKPQKAIPWAKMEAARAAQPNAESLRPRFAELQALFTGRDCYRWTDAEKKLVRDAQYCGLAYWSSMSQHGWTDAGLAALRELETVTA